MRFFVKILHNFDSADTCFSLDSGYIVCDLTWQTTVLMRIRHKKKQKKILMLVETTNHYGRGIIRGIDRYAMQNDWEVTFELRGQLEPLPGWLDSWEGDGVIVRSANAHSAKRVRRTGLPVVEMAGNQTDCKTDVLVDEPLVAKMAADHLLGCGFQNFAFYSYGVSWWTLDRGNIFEKEMNARGYQCARLQPTPGNVDAIIPKWSLNERKRLQEWLLRLPKPIAIFTAEDIHAREVLLICRNNELSVPGEVAVLGLGDDPLFCQYLFPPLSSIDCNGFQIGWSAAVLLDDLLKGGSRPVLPITVPPLHISVRQSTDAIAVPDRDLAAALRFLKTADPLCTSVADLVRGVHMSQKTLERRFRQYLSKTPEQEIMRIRLEQSKILLRETSFSLETVGLKTGFSSLEHFIRAFKREVGTTPSRYRLHAKTG